MKHETFSFSDREVNALFLLVMFRLGHLQRRAELLEKEIENDKKNMSVIKHAWIDVIAEIDMLTKVKEAFAASLKERSKEPNYFA